MGVNARILVVLRRKSLSMRAHPYLTQSGGCTLTIKDSVKLEGYVTKFYELANICAADGAPVVVAGL